MGGREKILNINPIYIGTADTNNLEHKRGQTPEPWAQVPSGS